jgi:hypothetical protein
MHVVLLTLMTLSGAGPIAAQQASGVVGYPTSAYASGCQSCGSASCNGASCGHGGSHYERKVNRQLQHYMSGSKRGPMPQTCYSPRYGCYHGNDRHMNRYPAFHGTYYRRPYNYRNLFEYPWHAEMHEPTSYFSYNVPPEAMNAPAGAPMRSVPQMQDAPPVLSPEAATQRRAMPMAPQPVSQPIFAPRNNSSAGMVPAGNADTVQFLPPPRLSDQDLAGVEAHMSIEEQRVAPAPIESTADATPYENAPIATRRNAPQPEFAPKVAARPLSATPIMLRPIAVEEQSELEAVKLEQPLRTKSIEARPISARRAPAAAEPRPMTQPQAEVKAVKLGQPQSIELKPLAPTNTVRQAHAEEVPAQRNQVQTTSATGPIAADNALRSEAQPINTANPLRESLRR